MNCSQMMLKGINIKEKNLLHVLERWSGRV